MELSAGFTFKLCNHDLDAAELRGLKISPNCIHIRCLDIGEPSLLSEWVNALNPLKTCNSAATLRLGPA